jgi:hypothetical protein
VNERSERIQRRFEAPVLAAALLVIPVIVVDDLVHVNGSMRILRADGRLSESQLSWTYRFEGGRLLEAPSGTRLRKRRTLAWG